MEIYKDIAGSERRPQHVITFLTLRHVRRQTILQHGDLGRVVALAHLRQPFPFNGLLHTVITLLRAHKGFAR